MVSYLATNLEICGLISGIICHTWMTPWLMAWNQNTLTKFLSWTVFELRSFKRTFQDNLKMEVEIYLKVDESKVAAYQKLAEDLGDEISITKPIKFEDLGLAPMENGKFQCLACSKILSRKQTAVDHYKKQHTSSTNQFEYKIQCPRCSQEIAKVWILQEAISEKCNSDKFFFTKRYL